MARRLAGESQRRASAWLEPGIGVLQHVGAVSTTKTLAAARVARGTTISPSAPVQRRPARLPEKLTCINTEALISPSGKKERPAPGRPRDGRLASSHLPRKGAIPRGERRECIRRRQQRSDRGRRRGLRRRTGRVPRSGVQQISHTWPVGITDRMGSVTRHTSAPGLTQCRRACGAVRHGSGNITGPEGVTVTDLRGG
jgi:hypothetical protein